MIGPAACALPGTASAAAISANVVPARIPRCAACIVRNHHPRALESQLDGRLGPSTARLVRHAGMWSCTSMAHPRVAARAFLTTTLLAVGLALPSVAIAAPPANDNYLGSTTIVEADGSLPGDYTDNVDTTEASTQPDTFSPTRDGASGTGGKPEPPHCPGGAAMGKTVWWDFVPPVPGGVEIDAAGFDAVVAIYEWN